MRISGSLHAPILLCALSIVAPASAQQATIPIHSVTAPSATSPLLGSPDEIREIAPDKLLVNDSEARKLLLFGPTLQNPTILADTLGNGTQYPRFGKLIPYRADSTLFADGSSRTFVLIDPQGKLGRTLAPPRTQDFNMIISTGVVGTDARGRLVYQGFGAMSFPKPPCALVDAAAKPAQPEAPTDSAPIIRADFDVRRIDTVGRAKTPDFGLEFPAPTVDGNCKLLSARMRVNPSIPAADSWTVTSNGLIAIVRSHDYHIDWIDTTGAARSTPKMPFDWRRLTDADKTARVDSARKIIDSLSAIGGYRLQMCAGGRTFNFTANPADPPEEINVGRTTGAGGRGEECQTVSVTAQFTPIDSMADYIPPIRAYSAHADLDGNVWVLPSTSLSAKGGLLYDVVNTEGQIIERVQLPGGRDIAGFGRGGVLYLSHGTWKTGYTIEKVKVVR